MGLHTHGPFGLRSSLAGVRSGFSNELVEDRVDLFRISHYLLAFDPGTGRGKVTLKMSSQVANNEVVIQTLDAEHWHALTHFLRNERPLFYCPTTGEIRSGWEVIGKEELD